MYLLHKSVSLNYRRINVDGSPENASFAVDLRGATMRDQSNNPCHPVENSPTDVTTIQLRQADYSEIDYWKRKLAESRDANGESKDVRPVAFPGAPWSLS